MRTPQILTWLRDDIFRRLLKNTGWLVGATGLATLFNLITMLLLARQLGPEAYGVFALVLVYAETVGRLASFQAWQAVIRYGSIAMEQNNRFHLNQLIKASFLLDAGGALIGFFLAISLSGLFISILGWNHDIQPFLVLYSVMILFNWNGTPVGTLRLFDRFDLLSIHTAMAAALRLLVVLAGVLSGFGLSEYLSTFLVTGILGQILLTGMSLYSLRENGFGRFYSTSLTGLTSHFPGFGDYVWTTNLNATIRLFSREFDLVIIAALTSPASVGIYKIAKQFAKLPATVFDPLYQSVYPELARLAGQNRFAQFIRLMKRTTFITGAGSLAGILLFALLGPLLIRVTVGDQYSSAYLVSLIYMLALVIALITFTFQPAMLALGLPKTSFQAQLAATVVYFLFLFILTTRYDVTGASMAYLIYYVVWALIMWLLLRNALASHTGKIPFDALPNPDKQ